MVVVKFYQGLTRPVGKKPSVPKILQGHWERLNENARTPIMSYLFLVKIVIVAEIISDMSKKGPHRDDGQIWLVVYSSGVGEAGQRFWCVGFTKK